MLGFGLAWSNLGVGLSIKALVRKERRGGLDKSYRSVDMWALEEVAGFGHLLGLREEARF